LLNNKPLQEVIHGETINQVDDFPSKSSQERVAELLQQLQNGQRPRDDSPETTTDQLLNGLCYKDFPALRCAKARLTLKSKDKKLDVFFRSHLTAIVATLNLYLDPKLSYSW